MFEGFKNFALRGNIIDLAIGFTVGAAFSTIARSLVDDIIMPVVGLLLGGSDFTDLFILLRPGPEAPAPYIFRCAITFHVSRLTRHALYRGESP